MTLGARYLATASVLAAILAAAGSGARAAPAACAPVDKPPVVAAVERLLVVLGKDDPAALNEAVTSDFTAYDAGRAFGRDSLLRAIETAQRGGMSFRWSVTEPVVHLSCGLAWITYVNRGEVTTGGKAQPVTWLESAVLHYENGRWRVAFLHSSRAAAN